MTKLQLLNDYLTERLMVAVREILEVVGGTVLEYEEESARAHREIELLRRRLRDSGAEGPAWSEASQPASFPDCEGRSPAEPELDDCDWSPQQRFDVDTTLTEEKPRSGPRPSPRNLSDPLSPGGEALTSECLPFTAACLKSDHDQDSELPDLFKVQIESPREVLSEPSEEFNPVKREPGGASFSGSEQCADMVCLDNLHTSTAASDLAPRTDIQEGQGTRKEPFKGKRSHSCPQCGKTFCHMSRLKIHLRIHTGEKPYSCAQCGKRFNNDGTLKNHQRVHTEERLYCCPQCGMRFKDAYTCKKHQRVHAGHRLYCCSFCGKQFGDAVSLQNHRKVHVAERPYCCTLCGKQFMVLGKLNKHLRIHEGENMYS